LSEVSRSKIVEELRRLLVSRLGLDSSTVRALPEDHPLFSGELGMDSVDLLELVVGVEQTFGLTVPSEIVISDHFSSLDTLTKYICERLEQKVALEKSS
jgi:acyl carrier protein